MYTINICGNSHLVMKVQVIAKLEKVERWMLRNAADKEVYVFSLCLNWDSWKVV